jgi:hypothetical protein
MCRGRVSKPASTIPLKLNSSFTFLILEAFRTEYIIVYTKQIILSYSFFIGDMRHGNK